MALLAHQILMGSVIQATTVSRELTQQHHQMTPALIRAQVESVTSVITVPEEQPSLCPVILEHMLSPRVKHFVTNACLATTVHRILQMPQTLSAQWDTTVQLALSMRMSSHVMQGSTIHWKARPTPQVAYIAYQGNIVKVLDVNYPTETVQMDGSAVEEPINPSQMD